MTKTSTISISKFAYSFVSGENLGKEAIFLPAPVGSCSWRRLICLGVATFTARQKQLQSGSQNLHPLPLKSRLPEEKYHAYYSVFKQWFFLLWLRRNILFMLPLFLLRISGNGGLFRVPANEIYRDPKTRAAIIRVSRLSSLSSTCHKSKIPISIICWQLFTPTRKCRFASAFQPLQDMRAERNRQNKYFRC